MIKINFEPESNLGRWSVGLIIAMPILLYIGMSFVSFYNYVPAGETILEDIFSRPGVALSMLIGFGSGTSAFFCGIFGITRKKEKSILVFISAIMGFLMFIPFWV